jgi:hypothetical protein
MISALRLILILAFAVGVLFAPRLARADKVVVLQFTSTSGATSQDLDAARNATRTAVEEKGNTSPSDSEQLSAQMAIKDGVADTSSEYRAAGRASGSQWTVAGRVEPRGGPYRLELEACQIESGRVESLAREIDPPQAKTQIGEMLALLLRPEGIANADIPWERAQVKKPPQSPPPSPQPAPPPEPPKPPPVKHAYAESHPLALGAGGSILAAVSRPGNAVGSRTAGLVEASGGYALSQLPGLELRGDFAFSVAGPGSLSLDAGARYALPVASTVRLFAGPEAAVGVLFPTGGDRSARLLVRGSAFVALGIGERAQIELAGDAAVAPGGASSLVLVGGTLRGLVRF